MRKALFFLIVFSFILSFSYAKIKRKSIFSVEKQWSSDKVFKTPESVWYDNKTKMLYVSNINKSPSEHDANGFISKVSPNGNIIKLKWVKKLNAPKGLCTYKNKLYVSDIDELVEIDLIKGKILKRYKVAGAKFLNDVIADGEGRIYISDTSKDNSVIYLFYNGKIKKWLKDKNIKSPNGLYFSKGILYIGNSGDKNIIMVDIKTKKIISKLFVGTGIDGLILINKNYFLTSNWAGKTSLIHKNGKKQTLLDTTKQKINAADLGFVPELNLIIIPTFYDNRIIAFKLKKDQT